MDGNHKITKAEYYGTTNEAKCTDCGSTETEDCFVCDLCDEECREDIHEPEDCHEKPETCPERKPGGKCLSCGATWRD